MLLQIHSQSGDGTYGICRAGGLAIDYKVLLHCKRAAADFPRLASFLYPALAT